ncbi:MAG: DUF421 domain-containing protein [Eubacteriales bacterium]|nr:DUF421 domain-containing protein [Eubacteriales bacterium]
MFKVYLTIFGRTVFLYLAVLVLMRIMGKREVGQLSLFDLVVAIMIAELAAIPLSETSIPIAHGILPIVTLVMLQMSLAFITLKSQTARKVIEGTPSIIIEQGRILEEEMRRLRYNVDDMMSQMREQGIYRIEEVEYAMLETNGKLSIILKADKRPVIPSDLGLTPPYEGLPIPLISDGRVHQENLALAKKNIAWLEQTLASQHKCGIAGVLYATLDPQGKLIVYKKGEKKKTPQGR